MGRWRYRSALGVLACALIVAGCGDSGDDGDPADELGTEEQAAAVADLCDSVVALHSDIIDSVNAMSSLEVAAEPTERAELLADGIDSIISIGEAADPPNVPSALTEGMEARRQQVLADLRDEAELFRSTTQAVEQSERGGAVNRVFLLAEKLMSETEPRVTADTPDALVEVARNTESCSFVLQLPPDR